MVRHAPIHRRSGHSDIAICCGRNVRGSSPSTSVVPLSNQVTTLNHKRFKGFKMFSDGHSVIAAKIIASWQLLLLNAFVTLQEILLGFALSVIVAIPLAIAVVYSRLFERAAFPFMVSLQTIPKVALAPILVMWLGYGLMPKVMV